MSTSRPKLLIMNQYFWPGVEATAHLLSELCFELADDFEITVVTGRLYERAPDPGEQTVKGVRVIRVYSTAFDRSSLPLRALNYLTYLVQSARTAFGVGRPDVVLCMTDPPMLADVGLLVARRFGVPLVVVSQDVFPEIAVELKRLESPALVGLLRFLIRVYLERADRVVAIGETMRRRLQEKGTPAERLRVIPNWVDTSSLPPHPRDNDWARVQGLADEFVVMHSGNIGHAQDLDSLIRAATFLRDLEHLRIVIVGEGARRSELVTLAETLEVDHVTFLPYQPREMLPLSLATASLHVVGLARGLSGYVVPSRLYGVLSAGRPVIAAADDESETAQLVRSVGCGIVVPPGRPELLAGAIRSAYDGELPLEEMGRRGRDYVVHEADRDVAVSRYRDLLSEVVGR